MSKSNRPTFWFLKWTREGGRGVLCVFGKKYGAGSFKILSCQGQGSKLKKMSGRKFATSYENLVATLKMVVAKLIEAI